MDNFFNWKKKRPGEKKPVSKIMHNDIYWKDAQYNPGKGKYGTGLSRQYKILHFVLCLWCKKEKWQNINTLNLSGMS